MVAARPMLNPQARPRTPLEVAGVPVPGTRSRRRTVEAVEQIRAVVEAVADSRILAAEQDRSRIAQELHDEVGYRLTAAMLQLDRALQRCTTDDSRDDLAAVRQLLTECADGVHDVAFHLRPRVLTDLGLLPAVQGLARRAQAVSGIPVTASARGESGRIASEIELAAFRIVQEAVTNALKYSSATKIRIRLTQSESALHVVVQDNGVGFDCSAVDDSEREHCGLRGMYERASLVGGRLDVRTAPGCGTTIRAKFGLGKAASW